MCGNTNLKNEILDFISQWGGIDGNHHKQWVLDQLIRLCCESESEYQEWVEKYEDGDDGPETYEWNEGIAP